MLDTLRKEGFPGTMLKHFLLVCLFFPTFSSNCGSLYAPDFIFANVFALLATAGILAGRNRAVRPDRVWLGLLALLILYNASALYANQKQLGWYSSQLNITIPFLFFLALAALGGDGDRDTGLIRLLLKGVMVSCVIAIVLALLGYTGVSFMDAKIRLLTPSPEAYERRFNWIYAHKSQYAIFLVLFMALAVVYRNLFPKKWVYYAALGLLALCLVLSHTYTSMGAALLIFAGVLLDRIKSRASGFRARHLLWLLPMAAAAAGLLLVVSSQRDISSLGGRLPIWRGMIAVIRENPYGTGQACGLLGYTLPGLSFDAYNCHNVFLNFLLQFSIPAGLCCCAMFGFIFLVSLRRSPSFTTLGIWGALLIPMMMDWCLLLTDLPMFLLGLYLLFFSPARSPRSAQ